METEREPNQLEGYSTKSAGCPGSNVFLRGYPRQVAGKPGSLRVT